MPNKSIYVPESELPIFERAEQIAGDSLSSTILQSLRDFVKAHEHTPHGFGEVTLKIGKKVHAHKRFVGRLLAKGHFGDEDDRYYELFEVYQTPGGKIALYVRKMPGWWFTGRVPHTWAGDWAGTWLDWFDYFDGGSAYDEWWDWRGEYDLEVYDSVESMETRAPQELYNAVKASLNNEAEEILDI